MKSFITLACFGGPVLDHLVVTRCSWLPIDQKANKRHITHGFQASGRQTEMCVLFPEAPLRDA